MLKVNKAVAPTNQQRIFFLKKMQNGLKENKTPNWNLCLKKKQNPKFKTHQDEFLKRLEIYMNFLVSPTKLDFEKSLKS
jgi:hypothetical protein